MNRKAFKTDFFQYQKHVAYYETDAMGVVHHSNYIRYFEEARVHWLREKRMMAFHSPEFPLTLAVLETRCFHMKPAYFGDLLEVGVQSKVEGLKVHFQYIIFSNKFDVPICKGYSLHVPVDDKFKVCRLPQELKSVLEKTQWTEI